MQSYKYYLFFNIGLIGWITITVVTRLQNNWTNSRNLTWYEVGTGTNHPEQNYTVWSFLILRENTNHNNEGFL